ncbi:hypothetical protein ACFLX9_03670, partial [Chloroflexota bacterium]
MSAVRMALVGLAQAVATACFCAIVVTITENIGNRAVDNDYLIGLSVLLVFITSACITGGLVLGYPGYLVLKQRMREGIITLAWTVGWLIILLAFVVIGVVATSPT